MSFHGSTLGHIGRTVCGSICLFSLVVGLCASPAMAADIDEEYFANEVWPIFAASCVKCHGPEKQKGDLRLDSVKAIAEGSEEGAICVAGKPEESTLYTLVILPADHDDIMPAKGDPLTKEQTEKIRIWIEAGAPFGSWTEGEAIDAESGEPAPMPVASLLDTISKSVTPASPEALEAIHAAGALAMPLAADTPLIQVNFQFAEGEIGDAQLAKLGPLCTQVTWLNLAGTSVKDADLKHLAQLTNLTSLHLEKTAITDAGIAHLKDLPNLQYLNLYGTKVSDAGLGHLVKMPHLRKLYLWQTDVTKGCVAVHQKSRPDLLFDLGWELPPPAPKKALEAATAGSPLCSPAWL